MRVKIEEIQGSGLELNAPIERSVLDAALAEVAGYRLVSSTPLAVSFHKVSGQVHLSGRFSADLEGQCKRCLKPVVLDVPVAFALRMIAERPHRGDEDEDGTQGSDDDVRADRAGTFELDEVDAEPFDGKTIDLDPIVREQVLLALPVTVVCREDCRGLCGRCGQDLNEKDCGHGSQRESDPRLAKLKSIKLEN